MKIEEKESNKEESMENNGERKEIAKEALKALAEIEDTVRMENLVKDNKIEFVVNKENYRVRKPEFGERQEIDLARRKKYLGFVKDETYLFRKQWIEQYKTKGIDIVAMETRVRLLAGEIKDTLLRLATTQEPKDIAQLKQAVINLREEQFQISMEVTDLLSYSIEDQITVYVNSYTTYLVLEKKINDEWVRAYKSYEEFEKMNSPVIEQAFYYINYLIYVYGVTNESNNS